jgi:hypothetical protein
MSEKQAGPTAKQGLQQFFPGLALDPKSPAKSQEKVEAIGTAANSLITAKELQQYAIEHQDQIGRPGQIAQNVDRYINSWKQGMSFDEMPDNNQPALIFAKKYAAYLVGYERTLAGSNRAMTVQFQKRFNDLMSQNQFNAAGFNTLMNEQMQEVARATAAKDPAITGQGLMSYGEDIAKRSQFGEGEKHPNVTEEEYKKLQPGELYWWNGVQIPKK